MASSLLFLLAAAVLLAHSVTVCATQESCQESDLVVLTTASQLRREIKSQLAEALAEALPTLCGSQSNASPIESPFISNNEDIVGAIQELTEYMKNSINTTVKETVTELLTPTAVASTPLCAAGPDSRPSCRLLQGDPRSGPLLSLGSLLDQVFRPLCQTHVL